MQCLHYRERKVNIVLLSCGQSSIFMWWTHTFTNMSDKETQTTTTFLNFLFPVGLLINYSNLLSTNKLILFLINNNLTTVISFCMVCAPQRLGKIWSLLYSSHQEPILHTLSLMPSPMQNMAISAAKYREITEKN